MVVVEISWNLTVQLIWVYLRFLSFKMNALLLSHAHFSSLSLSLTGSFFKVTLNNFHNNIHTYVYRYYLILLALSQYVMFWIKNDM